MRHKEGLLNSDGTRKRSLVLSFTAKHLYISKNKHTSPAYDEGYQIAVCVFRILIHV